MHIKFTVIVFHSPQPPNISAIVYFGDLEWRKEKIEILNCNDNFNELKWKMKNCTFSRLFQYFDHFHQCIKMNFKTFSAPKNEAKWKWNGMASELACHKIANLWEEVGGWGDWWNSTNRILLKWMNAYDVIRWQLNWNKMMI